MKLLIYLLLMIKLQNHQMKIITTLHGTDITVVGNDPSYLPIVKFSIENSDGVTAVSEYLKQRTYKEFAIKSDIRVIHNFINPEEFSGKKAYEIS